MGSSHGLWLSVAFISCAIACTDERPSSLESSVRGDAGIAMGPTLRLNVAGRDDVYACAAGFTAAQVEDDQVRAIKNAPSHCQGSEGGFECECDGESSVSYAFGCVAALYEACDVEAEPVEGSGGAAPFATECEALGDGGSGRCVLGEDDYACACGDDDAELEAGEGVEAASPVACEQALFASCAPSCDDDFGACAPSDSGVLGEYACTCSTNEFTHQVRAATCDEALLTACNPLNESELECTGYGGACAVTDPETQTELSCTCVDRTQSDVEHVPAFREPRRRACRETLEATCGLGSPPDGAQCLAEGNGYRARCTRGPGADAPLTCECYPEGSTQDARVEQVEGHDCSMATLTAFCPELAD